MDNAFTVTPMSDTIKLKPGEVYNGEIKVANPEDAKSDFSFKVEISPYGVSGNNYDADIVTQTALTQLSQWMKIENPTGNIKPNEVATVKYTVAVPEDAPGGGQYAALVVSSNSEPDTDSIVNNVFSIASIVFAEIDGDIKHDGQILDSQIPGFVLSTPFHSSLTLNNNGNTHEVASLYLEVSNFFTGEVIYPRDGDSGGIDEVIMPYTTRYLEREIQDVSPVGIYKVKQTIRYINDVDVNETVVVACPVWFMFILFVAICSIIAGIIKLVLRLIRKKKSEI